MEGNENENEIRITQKQRVLEAQGREVPLDLFLYSCLEQERLLRANPEHVTAAIGWPELPKPDEGGPSAEIAAMEPADLVQRMVAWYRSEFPDLSRREPLDHEHLNPVIAPIVALNRDLDRIYRGKTGEDPPEYDKTVGNNKVWDDIAASINSHFPAYGRFFLSYIQWAHAVEPIEDFEPGSRPPVGRYAPRLPRDDRDRGGRGGRDGGRGGRDGGRGGRGGRDGGGRGGRGERDRGERGDRGARSGGERGPRPERGDRPPREPRGEGEDRPPRGARGEGEGRRPRGERGERGGRGEGRRRDGEPPNAQLEAAALAEVERAIETLNADASLDEVTLKPANSFYRRIQHQRIIDLGYHSFSVGEGPDRAVKVARKE